MLKISLTVFDKIKLKKIALNYTIVKKKGLGFFFFKLNDNSSWYKKDVV